MITPTLPTTSLSDEQRNKQLEEVAIEICRNLNVDPFETVGCGEGDTDTPEEAASRGNTRNAMLYWVPRWMLYRWSASLKIATDKPAEATDLNAQVDRLKTALKKIASGSFDIDWSLVREPYNSDDFDRSAEFARQTLLKEQLNER